MLSFAHRSRHVLVAVGLLMFTTAFADSVDNLTENLIKLRSEVDTLAGELQLVEDEHRQRMKFLFAQQGELEAQLDRERNDLERIGGALEKNRARVAEAGSDAEVLRPVLRHAMDELAADIRHGLPFKREERLAALDEIRSQMEAQVIPATKSANRLWAFYEDELRLTRENGLFRQAVEVDGSQVLADVARIGMVAMYYRTPDDRIGVVRRGEGGWQYLALHDSEQRDQVEALYDAFDKQIRSGHFVLPNPVKESAR